jgi:hypothetical protein
VALVLIGAIAVYNWVVEPHKNYLLAVQRRESVADSLEKEDQVIRNNIAVKKKKLKELKDEFKQVHTKLFDPVEARKFFSNIQALSEEANCIMDSLKFSPTDSVSDIGRSRTGGHITAKRAMLSVTGDYESIIRLMNKLQGRLEQVWVDSVRIKSNRDRSDRLKFNATITVYVIHNKEENPHD